MMREEMTPQRVWQEFTRAQNFNNAIELYETVEQNEDFYIGNQWRGVNAPNLDHPVMNMLCRVVKFFISSVMSDDIGISVTDFDESSAMKPVLDMLGVQFDQIMEGCGFKRKAREVIRNSAVDGDGCMHFYFDPEDDMQGAAGTAEAFRLTPTPGHIEAEIIENTNVHFGNPQSGDVQRQPYILLNFRRLVEEVRRTARENGGDADAIQPDEDTYKHGDAPEEGKVTVVRRYWKEKGRNGRKTVWFCEMTAGAVVRGPTDTGYSRYPIAFMPWEKVKNQYHGQAAITGMIPNQIFVNKLFAMAMQHVKQLAFPKVIYNRNLMAGRKWNNRVGEAIGVNGDPNVAVATGFRAPDMSAQVLVMIDKVIEYTRDTMGASDAALGNVTPDNTSAIIAVQKATSMPLELQRQDFYCFAEDSVRIWMDMMAQNYGVRMVRMKAPEAEADAVPALPDSMGAGMLPQAAGGAPGMAGAMLQQAAPGTASGIPVLRSKMEGDLSPAREDAYETVPFNFLQLKGMNLRLNVEVGAATYWSELMQVQTLDNLFAKGVLSDAVTYLENMPRGYIPGRQELIDALKKRQQEMEAAQMAAVQAAGAPTAGSGVTLG